MEYVNLGRTGLKVSRLCLGCMSFGDGDSGTHAWTLSERESRPFFRQALEAGTNFFDTANAYSAGTSEEITGRALRDFACQVQRLPPRTSGSFSCKRRGFCRGPPARPAAPGA